VDRDKWRSMLSDFRERMTRFIAAEQKAYDLADQSLPDNFAVLSLAKFSDEHYGLKEKHIQVQALGKKLGAPYGTTLDTGIHCCSTHAPGLPPLSKSFHLGTKGCLFDFTSELTEARYKALQSFDCSTRWRSRGPCASITSSAHMRLPTNQRGAPR
jgi:hypothetical protein